MNGDLGWYTIKPEQLVMLITLFIIFLIPIFDNFVYPMLKKIGINSELHKINYGFFFSALAFVFAAAVEWKIEENYISVLWLIPQFLAIATAEVFLWVATISFVYRQAPDNMKSVMTGFIYLTVAGGNLIVIVVSSSNFIKSQFYEFLFFAALMVVNILMFSIMARRFKFVVKE